MKLSRLPWSLFVATLLCSTAYARAESLVRYDVTADPATKKMHVTITAEAGKSRPLRFAIPVWTPGYYQILNFQHDISDVKGKNAAGREAAVSHPDDFTWELAGNGATISYDVKAEDAGFGFFRCHLDDKTGYVNGAAGLMYIVGGKERPATITYHVPTGWRVACSLDPAGPNSFRASNYDELIDCPAQLGAFEKLDFDVKGTPFSAILVGESDVDRERLKETLTRVSQAGIDIFRYAPFKRYYYLFHFAVGNFGGGLEHRNSTVLNIFGRGAAGSRYPYASLVAHEYFHAWNVKRLHPAVLGPFDYTQKVRSGDIWFCEGVTDYYASVLMRMAGITSTSEFLVDMAGRISQLQSNPARLKVSADEASRKAWEGGSFGFGGLDYYNKGSVLGLLLDVEIRSATDNSRSLDDVMRRLDERYGKRGVGYPEDGLLKAINQVSGKDMSEFYGKYVRSTDEIPWNDILNKAALAFNEERSSRPYLGASTTAGKNDAVVILLVLPGSAASAAGIKEGDTVLSLNGATVKQASWQETINKLAPEEKASVKLLRDGKELEAVITVGHRDNVTRTLDLLPNASAAAARVQAGLLRSNSEKVSDSAAASLRKRSAGAPTPAQMLSARA